jgi:hypothetical protein
MATGATDDRGGGGRGEKERVNKGTEENVTVAGGGAGTTRRIASEETLGDKIRQLDGVMK